MSKLWNGILGGTAAAAGGAATFGGLAYALFSKSLRRGKQPPVSMKVDEENNPFEKMAREGKAWAAAHREQCHRLKISRGGVRLVGYYYDQNSVKSVILVHGFAGSYVDRLCSAQLYFERGYNVLAIDCRGHGESGGAWRTMGYQDGADIVCWADYLVRKKQQEFLVLDGVSMGASAVLVAAGAENLPEQVYGIVADCGFTSIHDIFEHQMKHFLKLPTVPILPVVEWLCRNLAHISTTENSPIECVRRIQIPVLFIHGVKDDFVPYEMGVQLNNACGYLKKLLTVRGAGHADSCMVKPELYRNTVSQFLETLEL